MPMPLSCRTTSASTLTASPLACGAALCYSAVHLPCSAATPTMPCFVMVLATVMELRLFHTVLHPLCCTATVRVPCFSHAALPLLDGSDPVLHIAFVVLHIGLVTLPIPPFHHVVLHCYVALPLSCRVTSDMPCYI